MVTDSSSEILLTLGTRPEIIKMAPVIRELEAIDDLTSYILHTGQHYDDELSGVFFENLNISCPDKFLSVGSGAQGKQTASGLRGIESVILEREPAAVLALGDTNAVLSTALAASKTSPLFGHLEAGIRSFDRSMPEEVNRVLADQVADVAFAPTDTAVSNLTNEGAVGEIQMVGNTIVDACNEHASIAEEQSSVLERLELTTKSYAVATIHRPRNTDNYDRLKSIVNALDEQPFPVVFPAHPRTKQALDNIGFTPEGSLLLVNPLDYLDFLKLLNNARLTVTDSGGIQEESSVLEVPCLTVRPNTERPETIDAGVNELIEPGVLHSRLSEVFYKDDLNRAMQGAPDLYGDGDAGAKVVDALVSHLYTR